jgi:DNA-binding CsgD family transcriptional regulator
MRGDNLVLDALAQALPLSPKQLRALSAVANGLTIEMAAQMFDVKPSTVSSQLDTCRVKLRAKNTTHAVAIAFRQGLIL